MAEPVAEPEVAEPGKATISISIYLSNCTSLLFSLALFAVVTNGGFSDGDACRLCPYLCCWAPAVLSRRLCYPAQLLSLKLKPLSQPQSLKLKPLSRPQSLKPLQSQPQRCVARAVDVFNQTSLVCNETAVFRQLISMPL